MSLNKKEIEKITLELQKLIIPSRIEKIIEIEPTVFVINLYHHQLNRLIISLKHPEMRFHITQKRWSAGKTATSFLNYLRKHIQDGILENIHVLNDDRIVECTIKHNEKLYYLIIELIPKRANLLVLDSNKTILYSLNTQKEKMNIGDDYHLPEKKEYLVKDFIPDEQDKLYNQSVEEYYETQIEQHAFNVQMKKLSSTLSRSLKNSHKTLANLEKQKDECNKWEEWQQKGELLKTHFHLLKRGEKDIHLQNYFDPALPEIIIPLDPRKEPSDNLKGYFKKAKKLKTGLSYINEKIIDSKSKSNRINELFKSFEKVTDSQNLKDFISNYKNEPEIKKALAKKENKKIERVTSLPYHKFYSQKGKEIFVGKNSKNNDKLTFSVARGNDLWLHIRDYSGSHVIVPLNKNEDIDHETLLDATNLAIIYSKAKNHGEGEVIYTKKKYLSKRKNSAPGEVQVSQFKTIYLKLDPERLKILKDRSRFE